MEHRLVPMGAAVMMAPGLVVMVVVVVVDGTTATKSRWGMWTKPCGPRGARSKRGWQRKTRCWRALAFGCRRRENGRETVVGCAVQCSLFTLLQ